MQTLLLFVVFLLPITTGAQPVRSGSSVLFTYSGSADSSVALAGDFNGWSRTEDLCSLDSSGLWSIRKNLAAGAYQYKFVVDGSHYTLDPGNPVSVENHDASSTNSVLVVTRTGEVILTREFVPQTNPDDVYSIPAAGNPLYLNILWHQHQPLYVDPMLDQLQGPWVRTHATKDYYDMASMLRGYPDIHCTINLTSSLLVQLQRYYVDRLGPFIETKENRFDADRFLAVWKGKTDPWIDLALKPTSEFDDTDKDHIYRNGWNAFGISEVMIARFPEYSELKAKLDVDQMPGFDVLNVEELREAKFWFYLAHFDPDFLRGPVTLDDGSVCDLSDLVKEGSGERFLLRRKVTEDDCRRLVMEAYKVMKNVVPVHRSLLYDPESGSGQIDVITTPYYHPILPLIYDSDLARVSQPGSMLPGRYSYPADAEAQVAKAVKLYEELFGVPPRGMWPGEGAVAQPVLSLLRRHGITWTASDVRVLTKSEPVGRENSSPYRFPAPSSGDEEWIALVFRDTELSDRIGFQYQTYEPEAAAEDFVQAMVARQAEPGHGDRLLTVILDGENAWEWYRQDMDAKRFLHALYRKLSKLQDLGIIRTTTMSEYLSGNASRSVSAHPVESLPEMTWLWPGSWINGNFDTWIGESEENEAWEALRLVRQDLEKHGAPQPDPLKEPPAEGTMEWYEWMAWESMYAAEGSDWFWWYGSDQGAPGGDDPFDRSFRVHLSNVYKFINLSGREVPERGFDSFLSDSSPSQGQGVMAQSKSTIPILFTCDASGQNVETTLFIAGNLIQLGAWVPGVIPMFDDGTNGDQLAGDGVWSVQLMLPAGEEVTYKYINGGNRGEWGPGDEMPGKNRMLRVPEEVKGPVVISDRFGSLLHE